MLRRSCSVDAQNGLAYARWKQGDAAGAAELAREAARHAGDGGHVRLRVMALSMLARVDAREVASHERALEMSKRLEDELLLARISPRQFEQSAIREQS